MTLFDLFAIILFATVAYIVFQRCWHHFEQKNWFLGAWFVILSVMFSATYLNVLYQNINYPQVEQSNE